MRRSPRTFVLVAIVTTAAIGLGRAFQPGQPKPAGRAALLTTPNAKFDFGEAWEDQRFTWTLPLFNPTRDTVRVVDVRASCTCVSIEPRTFTIPPGGSRELKLVLDLTPRAFEKPGTVRAFGADIGVVTATDVVSPAPEIFSLRGTVRPVLDVQPRDPSFGTRSAHVQPPLPAKFTVVPAAALETLTAVCDSPGFTADVRPAGPGTALTVTVTPTGAMPAGAFIADVRLLPVQAGGKALPDRRVKMHGLITPDVTADPPQVAVGARPVGEVAEEAVSLASLTGRPVTVETATAHGDGVTADLMPNGGVRVRLAVARAGEVRGYVEVGVRAGTEAPVTVVVPVFGYGTAAEQQGGQR